MYFSNLRVKGLKETTVPPRCNNFDDISESNVQSLEWAKLRGGERREEDARWKKGRKEREERKGRKKGRKEREETRANFCPKLTRHCGRSYEVLPCSPLGSLAMQMNAKCSLMRQSVSINSQLERLCQSRSKIPGAHGARNIWASGALWFENHLHRTRRSAESRALSR